MRSRTIQLSVGWLRFSGLILGSCLAAAAAAQEAAAPAKQDAAKPDAAKPEPVKEGHSVHGEVFNEGPRQAAWLMPGMGAVRFPTTSVSEEAKQFVQQGVAQLHGYW
ncbi:MAG: hypothetical protein ACKON9_09080, partial [Planctomycetaceae bacterium]